jgi:hypothetical protein
MKRVILLSVMLFWATTIQAMGLGVTGKAGSLGIGVEVTKSLVPRVNVRGGVNFFNYAFDQSEGGNDYQFDLKLKSFSILADLHPIPGRGLRLSGGIVFNNNHLDMVGVPTGSYSIGNRTYTGSDVGTLTGTVEFTATAPYFGIGWGNAASGRFGLAFDLGVALQGSPQVSLSTTGILASDPTFIQELNREDQQLEDDISGFKYYPVVSLGLSLNLGVR